MHSKDHSHWPESQGPARCLLDRIATRLIGVIQFASSQGLGGEKPILILCCGFRVDFGREGHRSKGSGVRAYLFRLFDWGGRRFLTQKLKIGVGSSWEATVDSSPA